MIGILGGTFDPIHNGHLHIATEALARLALSRLQFMPCALPVHRDRPRANAEQRCRMIEMVAARDSRLELNRIEIERSGPSYTIDSLHALRAQSDESLLLILGSDAFNGFDGWRQPRQILELASLLVCVRPGIELEREPFAAHRVGSIAELQARAAGAILELEVDAIDCSSSGVRAALARGDIPRQWLQPEVADFIQQNDLYRRSGD